MKNLIYTIAAGGEKYLNMFDCFFKSLKSSNSLDALDVWVFTDSSNVDKLKKKYGEEISVIACTMHPNVFPNFNNVKFEIHRHLPTEDYEYVLYSDIDILVNGDLNDIFKVIQEDKIYAMHERGCTFKACLSDAYHFYSIYGEHQQHYLVDNNASLYCAGFFGFYAHSQKIKELFSACLNIFDNAPNLTNLIPLTGSKPGKGKLTKIIDQAVFNTCMSFEPLLHGRESCLAAFPGRLVCAPPFDLNYNHVILHFIHPFKDERLPNDKLEAMQFFLNQQHQYLKA